MRSFFQKACFYLPLYATYWGWRRRPFREIPKEPFLQSGAPRSLKIFFWAPTLTPGVELIIHDILPDLRREIAAAGLNWDVRVGEELPTDAVDWLISFKAVPDAARVVGQPRQVLLICDIVAYFWEHRVEFDAIVCTSSRTLAAFFANGHRNVTFIGEAEAPEFVEPGRANLARTPGERGPVLMWHGGPYSMDALLEIRPQLERLAATREMELHLVSGQKPASEENWGRLKVKRLPWSKEQLVRTAAIARLGLAPARASLRASWVKPGSRIRRLYALGVPAIGDARVPDAAQFLGEFGGPVACNSAEWEKLLGELWDAPEKLRALAAAGQRAVTERHSTHQTAWQWMRYFAEGVRSNP
ncbi:MAG: glycosyltransferase family 1 protein [Verrucomicrobia bacterium]|nr:glycosyltransferase family 1 protein [Verrucomicrobiota bacterium]